MTQPSFDLSVGLPVSGTTPLARHCSATGASVAVRSSDTKLRKLLAFLAIGPGTTQEFAAAHGWQVHAVTSTVDKARDVLGWIEHTGETKAVWWGSRVTKQAYYRLTERGQMARERW
jgi:hypothetical protein